MPFTIERNDLSRMGVDAIVVAANEQLQITGGVGGVVAREAGFGQMQQACDAIGYCPTGQAVATPGFALVAKTVIHAVGPVWQGGASGEAELLRSAYDSALACAVDAGAQSIALPLISAGSYGFPPALSLSIAREAVRAFLNGNDADVHLVLYGKESVRAGLAAYVDIAEFIDDHYVEQHPADRASRLNVPYGRGGGYPDSAGYSHYDAARVPDAAPSSGYGGQWPRESASHRDGYPDSAAPAPCSAPSKKKRRRLGFGPRIGGVWESLRERREKPASSERADEKPSAAASMPESPDHFDVGRLDEGQLQAADACDAAYAPASIASTSTFACPQCGRANSVQARFCVECGYLLSQAPSQESAYEPLGVSLGTTDAFPPVAETAASSASYPSRPAAKESLDFAPRPASLEELLASMDASFSTTLLALIDARGMTDAQVYKRANVSRQLFSKIRGDVSYRPTKKTALALAIALELNLDETGDLLRRAGYALSNSSKADVIVEYHILHGNYDIFQINEALYAFDQPLL